MSFTKKLSYNSIYIFTYSFLLSCCLIGCQSKNRNIQSYYLPFEEIREGLAYEYHSLDGNEFSKFYWYFELTENEDRTILSSIYYDYLFNIQQWSNEEIVSSGVLLNDLSFYNLDTLQSKPIQTPVEVEWDNVFPFEVTDSSNAYLYKIHWETAGNPVQKIRLIRNRHYMGDTLYTYKGQPTECIHFLVKELIEIEEEGFQELHFQGIELYAKGIGLIHFQKSSNGKVIQTYQLADRLSAEELEQRFKHK